MKTPEVRVLSGRWKGRRLAAGSRARPTSSRGREALFDILGESVVGAAVLDLYAGSGAVGFEAVSRGARSAVLVEPEAGPLEAAARRLEAATSELQILSEEASSAVARLAAAGERFDFVFADPPYGEPLDVATLAKVTALLVPGGRLVLQRDAKAPDPALPGLVLEQRRAYGRNVFLFFGMR